MTGPPGSAEQSAGASPTTAWFHCFAGIAGDMALGSLLDAGADLSEVVALLERLPLRNWRLSTEPVLRAGIAATRALVDVTDDVIVRTHSHIVGLIEEARLPPRVARRALDTFAVLADVEGRLHRRSPSQVHFHEVGSHDTIIDVVGTAAALEVLDVEVVTASAVATGTGTVRTAHGFLPNPSPAVVRLLEGIPTWGRDISVELTTPTGAALLAAMATGFGPLPPMRIASSGFGAGSNEIDGLPNCTQVVLGESQATAQRGQPLVQLEANLDDATGETLAHAVGALLDEGALDAWITPVIMKKGRPGYTVTALVDPALVESVRRVLRAETGSLGVRATAQERWPATRVMDEVDVEGVPVRVKVSPGRVKVEHADAARRRPHRAPSARGRHQGRSCLAPTRRVRRRAARTPAWARRGHCLGHGAAEGPDTGVAGRDPSRRPFPGVAPVPWMSWHPQRPDHPGSHQPTRRTGPTRSGWPGWRPPISTPPGPRPAPVWPPGAVIPWAASSVRPCWACATPSTDAPTTRWPSSRRPEAIPPMTTSTTSGSIPTIRSARRSSSDPGPRFPDPRPAETSGP